MGLIAIGCDRDSQLAAYAERARQEQARQNERMAEQSATVLRQNEQLAKASQDLVGHDAAARRELLESQAALQAEFQMSAAAIDRQREQLAREREQSRQAALREPLVAEAVSGAALLLAALLPLLIAAYALTRLPPHTPGESWLLAELNQQEFWAGMRSSNDQPLPPSLARAGLPAPSGPDESFDGS